MDADTIILLAGICCVFLGIFGGGFQIKELTVPKIGVFSRSMGSIFGIALIALSTLDLDQLSVFDSSANPDGREVSVLESKMDNVVLPSASMPVMPTPVNYHPIAETPSQPLLPNSPQLRASMLEELTQLQVAWNNPLVSNRTLQSKYHALQQHVSYGTLNLFQQEIVDEKIAILESTRIVRHALEAMLSKNDATLYEKQQRLSRFLSEADTEFRLDGGKRTYYQSVLDELDAVYQDSARIEQEEHFVSCRAIVQQSCQGVTTLFRDDSVSIWAKLSSPSRQKVTMKWMNVDSDETVYSRSYEVSKSNGYRIFSQKTLTSGTYQVRLYNQAGYLLGQVMFKVV